MFMKTQSFMNEFHAYLCLTSVSNIYPGQNSKSNREENGESLLHAQVVLTHFKSYLIKRVKTSWTYSRIAVWLERGRNGKFEDYSTSKKSCKIFMVSHNINMDCLETYRAFHKLPPIYTANHATFPIQMYAITVQLVS